MSDSAAVTISSEERPRYLLAAYKDAPINDRPRNFIGLLKDMPAADMESMLHDHASVSDDMLASLATRRAEAVKEALEKRGVASERLFIVSGKLAAKGKEAGGARVDLALK